MDRIRSTPNNQVQSFSTRCGSHGISGDDHSGIPDDSVVIRGEIPGTASVPTGVSSGTEGIVAGGPDRKKMTVLFYMNGQYQDIGQSVAEAIIGLESVGSDDNMNLVAQLGRLPGGSGGVDPDTGKLHIPIDGDWSNVRRYEIRQDSHEALKVPAESWEKVHGKIPDNPLINYILREVHASLGNKEKAAEHLEKAKSCGLGEFTENPGSPKSREVIREFNEAIRPLDEAKVGKYTFSSKLLEELPSDATMFESSSLKDFISMGMEKYPAEHYVLVCMGHGDSWGGVSGMSPAQFREAIESGTAEASKKTGNRESLDALVFNACYMGNVEALTELKDTAKVTIASQNFAKNTVFGDWPAILQGVKKDLEEGKSFDSRKFGSDLVDMYRKFQKEVREETPELNFFKERYSTLAAVDNSKLDDLKTCWGNLLKSCRENGVSGDLLFRAVNSARNYPKNPEGDQTFDSYSQLRDMGSILDAIIESDDFPPAVKGEAEKTHGALRSAIISEQHEGIGMEGSQGLSIWAPGSSFDVLQNRTSYVNCTPTFSRETGWADTLKEMADKTPQEERENFNRAMDLHNSSMRKLSGSSLAPAERLEVEKKQNEALEMIRDIKDRNSLGREEKTSPAASSREADLLGMLMDEGKSYLNYLTKRKKRI